MSASKPGFPALASIVAALPAVTPFVPPEALERQTGRKLAVRIGANESNFGPSPAALAAMRQASLEIQYYCDPEGYDLRQALARHHGITMDHIVLGAGADELLGHVVRAFVNPGETVVMSTGGYPTFAYQVAGHGGQFETRPYRADRNDGEALVEAARQVGAKMVYLSNPDNPTGSYLTAAEQLAMLERLPPNCLFVLDEAYVDFAPPDAIPVIVPDDPRVVRIRTFSKAHGMAGMRVGYAFGAPELIRPIDRFRNHFGVSRIAQDAALASLGDQDYIASIAAAVAEGRAEYAALAAELGLNSLPSATNFVAIDLGSGDRARAVLKALFEREGVFVRMPGVAPLDRCIRVSVGRPHERAAFAAAFKRVLADF